MNRRFNLAENQEPEPPQEARMGFGVFFILMLAFPVQYYLSDSYGGMNWLNSEKFQNFWISSLNCHFWGKITKLITTVNSWINPIYDKTYILPENRLFLIAITLNYCHFRWNCENHMKEEVVKIRETESWKYAWWKENTIL